MRRIVALSALSLGTPAAGSPIAGTFTILVIGRP